MRGERESVGLLGCLREGARGLGNRTSDMLARRNDPSLSRNEFTRSRTQQARDHEEDEDGML